MDAVISAEADLDASEAEKELLRLRSSYPELIIQVVKMKRPLGARTVRMIAMQTLRARKSGALLAERPEVDLLLRLAGTDQITMALKTHGYKAAGTKLLAAAGPQGEVDRLRTQLSGNGRYTVREEDEADEEGLAAVETAALLGTRV